MGGGILPFYIKLKGYTPYSMNTCFVRFLDCKQICHSLRKQEIQNELFASLIINVWLSQYDYVKERHGVTPCLCTTIQKKCRTVFFNFFSSRINFETLSSVWRNLGTLKVLIRGFSW